VLIRSQSGELVNLAYVARVFVDANPDGTASVVAAVPVPGVVAQTAAGGRHSNTLLFQLAGYPTAEEAQAYVDELALLLGAVTPRLPSELPVEEVPQ